MRLFGFHFGREKPEQIKYLGTLAKLEINDGDTCVLMVPIELTEPHAEMLKKRWEDAFGGKVKCLVLDSGITVGVLSQKVGAVDEVEQK